MCLHGKCIVCVLTAGSSVNFFLNFSKAAVKHVHLLSKNSPNSQRDTQTHSWSTNPTFHGAAGQIVRRNMPAVGRSKSAVVVARSWRKNNGKHLSSECGGQQRSPLMWLLAVSLSASSFLIYTTAAIHNPNKPQTTNYVRLILSAYCRSKTEEKLMTTDARISAGELQTAWWWSPGAVCCGLTVGLFYGRT